MQKFTHKTLLHAFAMNQFLDDNKMVQVAQLSLTNPRDALHHDKWQNFKTVT